MTIENYLYGDEQIKVPDDLNVGAIMLEKCKQYGDKTAITNAETGESLSYDGLWRQAVRVARALLRLGLEPGDIAAVSSPERLDFYPTLLGIMCAGGTYTNLDTSGSAIILHKLNLSKPKVIFMSQQGYKTYKNELNSVESIKHFIVFSDGTLDGAITYDNFLELDNGDDVKAFSPVPVDGKTHLVTIYYSSGTTGLPKAVPWTHNAFFSELFALHLPSYSKGTHVLMVGSEFCQGGFCSLYFGVSAFFTIDISPKTVLKAIEDYKISIIVRSSSMLFDIATYPKCSNHDLSSLKLIISMAAALKPSISKMLMERFPNSVVCQWYGCTEAGVICKDGHLAIKKPGSVGRFYAGVGKFVDLETGKVLGPNKVGEIFVKNGQLTSGYLNQDYQQFKDEVGFYRTGDLGYYDEDKYVFLKDRVKDIINYGGMMISPELVETILLRHPSVAEVAVVGAPDEAFGEVAVAFVVPHAGYQPEPQEILDFVNPQLYAKTPLSAVRIIAELPRGRRGKLDRKELRRILC